MLLYFPIWAPFALRLRQNSATLRFGSAQDDAQDADLPLVLFTPKASIFSAFREFLGAES